MKHLTDEQGAELAKAIAKSRSWVKLLPSIVENRPHCRTIAYKTCRVHKPGEMVLVADSKSMRRKPRYRFWYIGTYSTNGYGHYRLLRSDGRQTSCGTILNLRIAREGLVKRMEEEIWNLLQNDDTDQVRYLLGKMGFEKGNIELLVSNYHDKTYDEFCNTILVTLRGEDHGSM